MKPFLDRRSIDFCTDNEFKLFLFEKNWTKILAGPSYMHNLILPSLMSKCRYYHLDWVNLSPVDNKRNTESGVGGATELVNGESEKLYGASSSRPSSEEVPPHVAAAASGSPKQGSSSSGGAASVITHSSSADQVRNWLAGKGFSKLLVWLCCIFWDLLYYIPLIAKREDKVNRIISNNK